MLLSIIMRLVFLFHSRILCNIFKSIAVQVEILFHWFNNLVSNIIYLKDEIKWKNISADNNKSERVEQFMKILRNDLETHPQEEFSEIYIFCVRI